RQAFLSIPKELEDAAIMDGCSAFTLWWKILLPIVAPSLATLAVFAFVGYWNSFLWPLIILTNTKMYPLSVGLTWLSGTFSTNFRIVAAGAVLAMLPTLIIFLGPRRSGRPASSCCHPLRRGGGIRWRRSSC
ncbi:MAG: carbohydrate ABC transporter permease, partial [Nitrososphaerota archaeon]|nr:carbohydrate ABC transporter permease [Nitrososphaerota archaeon]